LGYAGIRPDEQRIVHQPEVVAIHDGRIKSEHEPLGKGEQLIRSGLQRETK